MKINTGLLMRRALLSVLLLAVCLYSLDALASEKEDSGQWTPLFNGKDLSGWTVKCKAADKEKPFWKVDQGTILADSLDYKGHDYVWLMSDKEYSQFVLRLKFQAYRDCKGNSGVQIMSRYDDNDQDGWLNGPQVDIHPSGFWRTGMMWDETRGNQRWIFPDLAEGWVNESMAKPGIIFYYSDEKSGWNDFEIKVEGLKVTAKLNGVIITDFNGDGILNDEIHKKLNVGQKGFIALQIHKGDQLKIRFKDIKIKELK